MILALIILIAVITLFSGGWYGHHHGWFGGPRFFGGWGPRDRWRDMGPGDDWGPMGGPGGPRGMGSGGPGRGMDRGPGRPGGPDGRRR